VALANKNARILWALMTKGEAFDANHLSIKPGMSSQQTWSLDRTLFIAAGKPARCSDRSDRRRASSTNPRCRCPTGNARSMNGAPPSGSYLGPHTQPHGWTCNKADTREAVCSSLIASPRPADFNRHRETQHAMTW